MSLAIPQFNPNSPLYKKPQSSLLDSSPLNISMDTLTTRYSKNSNDILQSEVIFDKSKLTNLKNDLPDNLRIEIRYIIKKQLESLHTQFDMLHIKLHY